MIEPIDAAGLKARLDAGEDLVLLDVREDQELAICRIEGALHIPLGELTARWQELDPERPTVCICHHGMRSAQAAQFLLGRDFDRLYNLSGGVDAWAARVDPGMARY
jgi:rhodanese-related sulfurtransferase